MKQHFNKKSGQRLRVKSLQSQYVHTIEAGNPKSLALLAKAYKDVYEAAFPIDEERESLESWIKSLKGGNPAANIIIVVAGDELDSEKPVLKAISVAYYYNKQDAGLLAYNAVSPDFQGQGLGRIMVEARKTALLDLAKAYGNKLGGVFIECNDPAKITPAEDVMDPATRIKMFEKWGAKVLPIHYVQPPLEHGGEKCDALKLLAYPHPKTGKYPTPEAIKGFITGIYTELAKYAGCEPQDNPDYIKTMQQIDAMKPQAAPKQKPPSSGP